MSDKSQTDGALSQEELDELVASSDTGGRSPSGPVGTFILLVALAWSLFQLWIASPIPFMIGAGVFNDTEARSIHLAFALFLAFAAYPAARSPVQLGLAVGIPILLAALFMFGAKEGVAVWWIPIPAVLLVGAVFLGSPKEYIPSWEWALGIISAAAALYLYLFYDGIANRVGAPIMQDYVVAVIGIMLLLEATRRALGPALMIVASVFLIYTFLGPYMPGIIAHKGNSLSEVVNHQWITTEGVFGIALGVSTSFVFLFVLFGSLLDKAGAGNYFIQVAFSLMGHMRGGPAKAAVVSSAMTGLISGSSIANVVTTGTFTIPLMKRVGFSSEKAGAVEVASSVNGQIMPPVMGAAAFLMVEYVGISYVEVITHAFLPAIISYIALVYIVHLEAVKNNMPTIGNKVVSMGRTIGGMFAFFAGFALLCYATQYPVGWIVALVPVGAGWILAVLLGLIYVALVALAAKAPDLEPDDPEAEVVELPDVAKIYSTGLYYMLPIIVLVYFLMIERKSPGLSAFWATFLLFGILLTQKTLKAMFRGEENAVGRLRDGLTDLMEGMIDGARNMIGIGLATATAGIIVGTVSLTGIGQVMADFVEFLSGGNLILMLIFVAILSLILGMGLPTTANYIVVSSLMVAVVVELGAQSGLVVPLIAVHLFVFYFGIMADVTPPVGLASFAAAAVSGGDAIRTGFTAFFYSLRTVALPFVFIFNTDLLLIDVTWTQGIIVFIVATIGILVFTAATMGWFMTKNRIWETVALLAIAFALFRPGFFMDQIQPPFEDIAPADFAQTLGSAEPGSQLRTVISGPDFDTLKIKDLTVPLTVPEGDSAEARLDALGLILVPEGDVQRLDEPGFGSDLAENLASFDFYADDPVAITSVQATADQLPKELIFIPALILLALIAMLQLRRAEPVREGEMA